MKFISDLIAALGLVVFIASGAASDATEGFRGTVNMLIQMVTGVTLFLIGLALHPRSPQDTDE
jgi:hypothetical protein